MIKLMSVLFVVLFAGNLAAQDIGINNMSGCKMIVTVYAEDGNSSGCTAYVSNPVTLASGGTVNDTWSGFTSTYGWVGGGSGPTTLSRHVTGYMVQRGTGQGCSTTTYTSWFIPSCGSTNCAVMATCSCTTPGRPNTRVCAVVPGGGPFAGVSSCFIDDAP